MSDGVFSDFSHAQASTVALWRADALGAVPHGFAGRRGGVSTGLIASLNCGMGAGDDPAAVAINRRRVADAVLPHAACSGLSHAQTNAALTSVHQVHSAVCVTVDEVWSDDARPHADALVTARPGVLLGIVTADCVPVLLADADAGVVGGCHAGWRGALAGVTDATVAAMAALGAQRGRIVAAIGPCIARASYEVDAALFDAFVAADPANARFFADGKASRVGLPMGKARQTSRVGLPMGKARYKRHWQFDLEGYVAARLASAGVQQVEALGLDTYAREDDFYSYRRATHRGEPSYGRQLSLIGVPL